MLRFFRKIRQNLLENGNIRKYFWYALGEILLVMIGILLAVQVNSVVQNSRDEGRRVELVQGLASEFSSNLSQLDTVMFYQNKALESGNDLIREIAKRNQGIKELRVDTLISNNSWLWTYDPLNGVLKSGISSGDIHLITNDSLKVLLFSWEDVVSDAREEQMRAVAQYQDHILPYLKDHTSISNTIFLYRDQIPGTSFEHDYAKMMFDPKFENLIITRSINTIDALNELEILHELNTEIIQLLEAEL